MIFCRDQSEIQILRESPIRRPPRVRTHMYISRWRAASIIGHVVGRDGSAILDPAPSERFPKETVVLSCGGNVKAGRQTGSSTAPWPGRPTSVGKGTRTWHGRACFRRPAVGYNALREEEQGINHITLQTKKDQAMFPKRFISNSMDSRLCIHGAMSFSSEPSIICFSHADTNLQYYSHLCPLPQPTL